ncbi:Thymidylate synthase [Kaumoebavirus]|uniref:Thymidylate synthase n=1 Tax=Kaumoebavirus TaxID=1859492 RepID=UPI0009C3AD49|nr:Thymidylate synthase [Kaumoebavirus]ARA71875.1 Thymidylate synthase [Kaumoebavirus]
MDGIERQYLQLVETILKDGQKIDDDRTGVGTYSVFRPAELRHDMSKGFPLLTTRKMFFRGVVEEMIWFLNGCTDSKVLAARGVKIWEANSTRAELDKRGLTHYREGDIGPTYGFNFRSYGATYLGCQYDYEGMGFDQVAQVVRTLREFPSGRRHVIDLWDPNTLNKVALPPCAMYYQFYVRDGKLDCHHMIRSSDVVLGLPWNIASAAVLMTAIAAEVGLGLGILSVGLGDAHIYQNHIDGIRAFVDRAPKKLPKLKYTKKENKPGRVLRDLDSSQFVLEGYECWPSVLFEMAV